ncbi:MAG: glycerophosphodiester phosphodiesterase [Gemmataceae bacterium]
MMMLRSLLVACVVAVAPLWAEPKVEIIAHRGASWDAPENTVASFREAWKQNADGGELDVHLTKDGKLVVIHDATLQRTSGLPDKVRDLTLEEICKLDAGKWKDAKFAGEKYPTLEQMLATRPAGKKVYVELKSGPEAVPELIRVLDAAKVPADLTPVISFNAEVIAAFKKERPKHPAYWIVALTPFSTAEKLIERAKQIKADGLDLSARPMLDAAFAKKVKEAGLRLDVWTVNDAEVARRMVEIGVQGITTDRPGWLREQLNLK